MNDIITCWILPLLLYGGPIFPAIGIFILPGKTSSDVKGTLLTLLVLHILAFVPFTVGLFNTKPDSYGGPMLLLFFPMLTGGLGFLASSSILLFEGACILKEKYSNHH